MQKKLPDKLVLDSNIIVSAALNAKFQEIVALKAFYKIEIYTCNKQISELERTFIKLYGRLNASPEYYITLFEQLADHVEIDERFDRSPDPKDNYLFDLAYKVKSYYVVTGEKALLNMKQVNQIKIISIVELRKILKNLL
jgi:putative PIN family toxin of toxin-antitoxin system